MNPPFVSIIARPAIPTLFTPGHAYGVVCWRDGIPQVRNDHGSLTWLLERRWWAPAERPSVASRLSRFQPGEAATRGGHPTRALRRA